MSKRLKKKKHGRRSDKRQESKCSDQRSQNNNIHWYLYDCLSCLEMKEPRMQCFRTLLRILSNPFYSHKPTSKKKESRLQRLRRKVRKTYLHESRKSVVGLKMGIEFEKSFCKEWFCGISMCAPYLTRVEPLWLKGCCANSFRTLILLWDPSLGSWDSSWDSHNFFRTESTVQNWLNSCFKPTLLRSDE